MVSDYWVTLVLSLVQTLIKSYLFHSLSEAPSLFLNNLVKTNWSDCRFRFLQWRINVLPPALPHSYSSLYESASSALANPHYAPISKHILNFPFSSLFMLLSQWNNPRLSASGILPALGQFEPSMWEEMSRMCRGLSDSYPVSQTLLHAPPFVVGNHTPRLGAQVPGHQGVGLWSTPPAGGGQPWVQACLTGITRLSGSNPGMMDVPLKDFGDTHPRERILKLQVETDNLARRHCCISDRIWTEVSWRTRVQTSVFCLPASFFSAGPRDRGRGTWQEEGDKGGSLLMFGLYLVILFLLVHGSIYLHLDLLLTGRC